MESNNTPTLRTERLLLRKFKEDDMEALFAIFSDQAVNTYLPWYPLTSRREAWDFFSERYAKEYQLPCGYKYAICLKNDNIPIGYINVSMEEHHDFGYGLRQEFWHRGIVTEAGRAVAARLRADGLPFITATHDINNPRSGAVMKKLGMSYQYTYQEQWQPKDILVTFRMYQLNLDGENARVYSKYWETSSIYFVETDLSS